MKALALAAAFALTLGLAHAADVKGMDMKGGDMKDMSSSRMSKDDKGQKHVTKGTVKSIDAKAGTVTLDHEPVKSLNWPAMSMPFKVQDQGLMDKLTTGKKVEVSFEQRGKDYVITSAR